MLNLILAQLSPIFFLFFCIYQAGEDLLISNKHIVASTCVLVDLYFPRDFPVYLQHI